MSLARACAYSCNDMEMMKVIAKVIVSNIMGKRFEEDKVKSTLFSAIFKRGFFSEMFVWLTIVLHSFDLEQYVEKAEFFVRHFFFVIEHRVLKDRLFHYVF